MKYLLKTKEGMYLEHIMVKGKHTWAFNPSRLHASLFSQSSAYRLRRRFPQCVIFKTMTKYVLYTMVNGSRSYVTNYIINNHRYDFECQAALDFRTKVLPEDEAKRLAKLFRCLIQEVAA